MNPSMKKLVILVGLVSLIAAGCTKDIPGMDPTAPQDVVFTSNISDGGALKGMQSGDPVGCSNPDADYALVVIDDQTFYPAVFMVDGVLFTQAVKLVPNLHILRTFALMDDNGTPNDRGDDKIVRATPERESDFSVFVTNPVSFGFQVAPFDKSEIPVEVLCFEETKYKDFGFSWFTASEASVRQLWFFGDFCTKNYLDYAGSEYEYQFHGLQIDMPAIFKIEVLDNGMSVATYTNQEYHGEGKPLSVKVSDRIGAEDNFELKLYIMLKTGDNFGFKYMNSWFFKDNEQLVTQNGVGPGADGVYDFVVGNCNAQMADFAFAPYMNLPEEANMSVSIPQDQPTRQGYLKINFFGIGTGYDLNNGNFDAFCFDRTTDIATGTQYNVKMYSTLIPAPALPERIRGKEWDRVNWLANHLEQFDGYQWYELQQALWKIEDPTWTGAAFGGVPAVSFSTGTSLAKRMVEAASAFGDGYVPLPGGWAAVACISPDAAKPIQTVFTVVDP